MPDHTGRLVAASALVVMDAAWLEERLDHTRLPLAHGGLREAARQLGVRALSAAVRELPAEAQPAPAGFVPGPRSFSYLPTNHGSAFLRSTQKLSGCSTQPQMWGTPCMVVECLLARRSFSRRQKIPRRL